MNGRSRWRKTLTSGVETESIWACRHGNGECVLQGE